MLHQHSRITMTLSALKSSLLMTLIACAFTPATTAGSPMSDAPYITAEDIQLYRDGHRKQWAEKITPGKGRLLYTDAQWPEQIERMTTADGLGKKWRDEFFKAADRIVAAPILSYDEQNRPGDIKQEWQRAVGDNLTVLALAAKISPEPKYTDKLREIVRTVCDYPSWGVHNNDLAAGHIATGLSLAYDWNRSIFSEAEKEHIRETMAQRIPALLRGLLGQMYWRNTYTWNHNHISIAGMGMAGLAFFDEIPEADEWLAGAMLNYEQVARYSDADGGSCEGLGYWSYGRSFIIAFIEATRTVTDSAKFYDAPFLQNAAEFRVASSTPGYHLVLKWADGQGYDFRGPHHILYRLASEYSDGQAQYLANNLPFLPAHGPTSDAFAWTLLWYDDTVKPLHPDFLDHHASDWGVVTSRSGWAEDDYLFTVRAGLNNDAHSHLDAGALALAVGKRWFLTTSGYGLGDGRPGFWDRFGGRWNFFSNSSESHCTLVINGENQRYLPFNEAGGTISQFLSSPRINWTEADLRNAYESVSDIHRNYFHRRGQYILVLDRVEAEQPVTIEWIAQTDPYTRIALNEGKLSVRDELGNGMHLRMLNPDMGFEDRAPRSLYYDLKPPRIIRGYAAAQTTASARLAALVQPIFGDKAQAKDSTPIHAELIEDGDIQTITLFAENWRDTVLQAGGKATQLQFKTVQALAAALAVCTRDETIEALAALNARSLTAHELLKATADSEFSIAVDAAPSGGWLITLDTEGVVALSPLDNLRLFTLEGTPLAAPSKVAAGRYALVRSAEDMPPLLAWLTQLAEQGLSSPVKQD